MLFLRECRLKSSLICGQSQGWFNLEYTLDLLYNIVD